MIETSISLKEENIFINTHLKKKDKITAVTKLAIFYLFIFKEIYTYIYL